MTNLTLVIFLLALSYTGRTSSSHISDYHSRIIDAQNIHHYGQMPSGEMNPPKMITLEETYAMRDTFYCQEDYSMNLSFILIAVLISVSVALFLTLLLKIAL